jgi:hypothetical protein
MSGPIPLIDNIAYEGGPALGPDGSCGPGCSIFTGRTGPWWYDPIMSDSYTFTSDQGKFLAVNDFPTGFTAPFVVTVGGNVIGSFSPGQSIQFLNGGVNAFTISGIAPGVDAFDPMAFPIALTMDTAGAQFRMQANPAADSTPTAAPEPATLSLLGLGLAGLTARRFRRRK